MASLTRIAFLLAAYAYHLVFLLVVLWTIRAWMRCRLLARATDNWPSAKARIVGSVASFEDRNGPARTIPVQAVLPPGHRHEMLLHYCPQDPSICYVDPHGPLLKQRLSRTRLLSSLLLVAMIPGMMLIDACSP